MVRLTFKVVHFFQSPQMIWVTRLFYLILIVLTCVGYRDIVEAESRKDNTTAYFRNEALQIKFRVERNFYLYYFTLVIVVCLWRVHQIFEEKDKIAQDLQDAKTKKPTPAERTS